MSVKCKYQDIKAIYDWCEEYADSEARGLIGTQPSIFYTAYYTPSQANWSYQIGLVYVGEQAYEVVSVFGVVKAVRLANIPHYTKEQLEQRRF